MPRSVVWCWPSMNTGQLGASPVPGRLIPIFAAFDSPGTVDDAAHDGQGHRLDPFAAGFFQSGMRSRM